MFAASEGAGKGDSGSQAVQCAALRDLFDRGWGKGLPSLTMGDGEGGPITFNVITRVRLYGDDIKEMDNDPRASAAALLPKAAKANKPIFYERQGRRMTAKSMKRSKR